MNAVEVEGAVIGSALTFVDAAKAASALLVASDFTAEVHREAFTVIKDQVECGLEPSILSVSQELELYEGEHDREYLAKLVGESFSAAQIEHHCQILKEKTQQREIVAELKAIYKLNKLSPAEALERVQALAATGNTGILRPLIPWNGIDIEGRESGVSTGFFNLDEYTGVGWVDGQTSLVCAATKGGKSSLMVGSFVKAGKTGVPVIFATFGDLNPRHLKKRALKHECGMGGRPTKTLDRVPDFEDALARLSLPSVHVYYAAEHGRHVETLCAYVRKERPRIVFADYAQKIGSRTVGPGEKVRQMEFISGQLSDLADELQIPIVLGSQITGDGQGNFTAKYARALEEDAGLVLRIKREGESATIEIPYNRFGPSGSIPMRWNEKHVRFEEALHA
jgi:hypothetical protein